MKARSIGTTRPNRIILDREGRWEKHKRIRDAGLQTSCRVAAGDAALSLTASLSSFNVLSMTAFLQESVIGN